MQPKLILTLILYFLVQKSLVMDAFFTDLSLYPHQAAATHCVLSVSVTVTLSTGTQHLCTPKAFCSVWQWYSASFLLLFHILLWAAERSIEVVITKAAKQLSIFGYIYSNETQQCQTPHESCFRCGWKCHQENHTSLWMRDVESDGLRA